MRASSKKRIILESGKRKTAIARATLQAGKGRVRINKIPLEIYTPEIAQKKIMEPLLLLGDMVQEVDIDVIVTGGGVIGQAGAARTAVARGLAKWFRKTAIRNTLQTYDRYMLTGDPRRKEPKKFGGPGARRKKQKSYR
jgi:small subunit ribosomal protein S9